MQKPIRFVKVISSELEKEEVKRIMAIVPQRRISKTRKRKRRTHFKLDLPGMMVCPNCGEENEEDMWFVENVVTRW